MCATTPLGHACGHDENRAVRRVGLMLFGYAWQTLRHRRGAFLGAFLALFCAAR